MMGRKEMWKLDSRLRGSNTDENFVEHDNALMPWPLSGDKILVYGSIYNARAVLEASRLASSDDTIPGSVRSRWKMEMLSQ
jgi:hypothetical protein